MAQVPAAPGRYMLFTDPTSGTSLVQFYAVYGRVCEQFAQMFVGQQHPNPASISCASEPVRNELPFMAVLRWPGVDQTSEVWFVNLTTCREMMAMESLTNHYTLIEPCRRR